MQENGFGHYEHQGEVTWKQNMYTGMMCAFSSLITVISSYTMRISSTLARFVISSLYDLYGIFVIPSHTNYSPRNQRLWGFGKYELLAKSGGIDQVL